MPKRVIHLARRGDQLSMLIMLDLLVSDGRIVYMTTDEIPPMDNVDGIIVFGRGDPVHDNFQPGLVTALNGKPCIYIYTIHEPEIPGVVTIDAPCTYDELLELFDKTFDFVA